ncbi:MAG: hypothetical protein M1358_02580 [Chloroflexi bacterium]|nr:hypothetical protein [Chloroflexota bacterium]
MVSSGRLPAATAKAKAKLVTMPVFRNVASVAAATPKRSLGAAPIAALGLATRTTRRPSPSADELL